MATQSRKRRWLEIPRTSEASESIEQPIAFGRLQQECAGACPMASLLKISSVAFAKKLKYLVRAVVMPLGKVH